MHISLHIVPMGPIDNVTAGLGNALALNRQQAITLTSGGRDPWYHIVSLGHN